MSGEIDGIRAGRDAFYKRLRENGQSDEYARRKADEVARRGDQRIRDGRQPKPKLRD